MTRKQKLVQVKINTPAINIFKKVYSPGGNLQKFIDMEVVRLSEPYTPKDTTALEKSVFINTDFGSGRLVYTIYGNPTSRNTWNDTTSEFQGRPKRGSFWTIRMLADGGGEKLMKGIQRFMGRN